MSYQFRTAVEYGRFEDVKRMLADHPLTFDPFHNQGYALQVASRNGYLDVVKLLLQYSRPEHAIWVAFALIEAISGRHLRIIKLLLEAPHLDISYLSSFLDVGTAETTETCLNHPRILLALYAGDLKCHEMKFLIDRMTEIDQSYLSSSCGITVVSALSSTSELQRRSMVSLIHHSQSLNPEETSIRPVRRGFLTIIPVQGIKSRDGSWSCIVTLKN